MDKNSIFGILLIAAILIIWGVVQSPIKKNWKHEERQLDSLALVTASRVMTPILQTA